jgi:hypothetical protein
VSNTIDNGQRASLIAVRQAEWDTAEALRQKYAKRADELTAKHEAEAESKQTVSQAIVDAREQAKRGELEAVLRRRFIIAGGSAAEWDAQKEKLVADHIKQKALTSNEDPARQTQAGL